jgi:glycosyltransferase involved in cell wall biosynthesis
MKAVVMLSTSRPGGISQVVRSLCDSRLCANYRVLLLVTHEQGGILGRIAIFLRSLVQFSHLLITSQVALVHAHVAMRGSFWRKSVFLFLAALFGRSTIVHLHGSEFVQFYENECGPMRRTLIRYVFRHASGVIVLSARWRNYIRNVAPAANVVTIHNFIDSDRMRSEIENAEVERSPYMILFLGEIGHRKGIYDLVRALCHVVKRIPEAMLVAAGQGELDKLRQCASDLGVERHIVMPGWVSGEEKTRLLAQAAIYVLPSYNEGLPVSILEAMAAALPVVATPVGGIPDAIRDGEEGFLVSPGSIDELSDRIHRLLSDKGLRQRMGENGRRRLQSEFSSEVAIAAITALYTKCGA